MGASHETASSARPWAGGRRASSVATVAAALLLGAFTAPASGEVRVRDAAGAELVKNGSFERGLRGWRTNDRRMTKLRQVRRAIKGKRAVRLRAVKGRRNIVLNDRKNTVRKAPKGARYRLSAYVRSPDRLAGDLRVRVVRTVRGKPRRTRVSIHRARYRLTHRHWVHVSLTFKVKRKRSALDLNVVAWNARPGQVLYVDQVSLRRLRSVRVPVRGVPEGGGTLTNGCHYSARGVPECGAYAGAAVGDNASPAGHESRAGQPLGVHRTFWKADDVAAAVATARADLARRRVPWMSFKLPYSWTAMAAGAGDAWARDIAARLSKLDGPVWIAFHHEPEKDGAIASWRAIQERLSPIVRRTASNVAFTIILTGWNQLYGSAAYSLPAIWPRRTAVDVVGFDVYNRYGTPDSSQTKPADLVSEYFDPLSAWARSRGVAWGIAETGYTDATAAKDPTWLRRTYAGLVARGGVALAYFDSAPASATGDWLLDDARKARQFADVVSGTPTMRR
ncbi:carbohydrate binding domain-containing protein [Mumia qirimensis]|uniref:carbohydrate binding domain-containing protein n=1 Tax=Mumia qirimensis TaxID=3234852 RepID=UPI00351CD9CD